MATRSVLTSGRPKLSFTARLALLALAVVAASCASSPADLDLVASSVPPTPSTTASADADTGTGTASVIDDASSTVSPAGSTSDDAANERPDWLGQRTLPTSPDGWVVTPQTTPEELRDRQLPTIDTLPAPPDDRFRSTIEPVPEDVLTRSTWAEGCPVEVADLAYITMTFWGFDDQPHTGEMLINASQAENIVTVFAQLYEARFPIEEMRVVTTADLNADPTGDGNNTTSFVCRAVTGGSRFSEHAYGLAIDINPFHNPYKRGGLILPELAVDYLDRTEDKPGVVLDGDVAVEAFAAIGWGWGGDWRSLKDYQHFALNNR